MSRTFFFYLAIVGGMLMTALPATVWAGPGGYVAQTALYTWRSLAASILVVIVLFPWLVYKLADDFRGKRRTTRDLEALGRVNESFSWLELSEQAHIIVVKVYQAWQNSDINQAQTWIAEWYRQNQTLLVLNQWHYHRLRNCCKLMEIKSMLPLHVCYREKLPGDGEGSQVMLSVVVNGQDYLEDVSTQQLVQGDTEYKDYETVWTLQFISGKWKVAMIEDGQQSFSYSCRRNNLEAARIHLSTGFKYVRQP